MCDFSLFLLFVLWLLILRRRIDTIIQLRVLRIAICGLERGEYGV